MKAFQFPLERALEWRRRQLEIEESRFKQQAAALAELDRTRAELESVAIRAELTAAELARTVHAHPTLAEAWMEAAHTLLGEPIHSAPPRR